jgi:hypothetical protein
MTKTSTRMPCRGTTRPRPAARMRAILGLATVLAGTAGIAGTALARDPSTLRDLEIPVTRVPDWHAADYLPLNTSSWTRVDIPCNGGDGSTLQARFDAATPNTVLVLPANCRFRVPGTLYLRRSNVVLRGASRTTSILEFQELDREMLNVIIPAFPANEPYGNPRGWTAGFATGTQVLTVANTSGMTVGGWVRMTANTEPDWHIQAKNQYAAKLVCVGSTGGSQCSGLSANQIRLDRGLPSPFTQGGQFVEPMTGQSLRNVGIENVRFEHANWSRIEQYRSYVEMDDCYECWITDSIFGNGGNSHIGLKDTVRTVFRGNDMGINQCTDGGVTCQWNKGSIYFNQGTADNVFENNTLTQSPSGPNSQGGSGNVIAYNFMRADSTVECERHVFLHGQGTTATLAEGNDVDCMMQWDSHRDGQGYNNTFYRNRLRGVGNRVGGYQRGRLGGEDTGSHIHRFITVIGNHVHELMGSPQMTGRAIDESANETHRHQDTWVTHNVARREILFETSGQQVRTTQYENHVRNDPNPGWSNFEFPASLYRSEAPPWWCAESGPFPNIGAPSDRLGNYSKLPGQIRLEGGTCTTPTGTTNPLPAPVFLE